ncbi:MAG TPA: MerR family transcriptional regulator [Anaerolineae bacterium]|nr:MerR family transcriptional regulator [Anaerolineae bacterium]
MFRIGEFSKIAQVSTRLLRYYDKLGLLQPEHVDGDSGYRYYTAAQLPRLNRILALKELGLSLEQIQRMVAGEINGDEIRGMLLMRKAQIEQTLQDELARLRQVEIRLEHIESEAGPLNVVLKKVPAYRVFTYRGLMDYEELEYVFGLMQRGLPRGGRRQLGSSVYILHDEQLREGPMDVEVGYLVPSGELVAVDLEAGYQLSMGLLPAYDLVASVIHEGWANGGVSYNRLGQWIEANGYEIVGAGREIMLELGWPAEPEASVIEIQFPVAKRGSGLLLGGGI